MGVIEVVMFGSICDCCNERWYNDHYGWSAMNDESSLKDMLSDDEWLIQDGKTYCPSCYEIDDEDNIIIKSSTELK